MSKEELIALGKQYYDNYGKLPKMAGKATSNWKKGTGYTSLKTVVDTFGSWSNFIASLAFLEDRPQVKLIGVEESAEKLCTEFLQDTVWTAKKYTKDQYINAICSRSGRISDMLSVDSKTIVVLHERIFPAKQKGIAPLTYILNTYGYKRCPECFKCLTLDNFYNNAASYTGKHSICRLCVVVYELQNRARTLHRSAQRRSIIKSTLKCEEEQAIIEFYKKCPPGNHVDHIKPLSKGGTHTLDNLQYLSALDNLRKGSKYNGL
jgi:5-methylcytosine-specific restriction endonuclease McrA